jgi:energy-converting hydrogenase A subunit M
MKKLKLLNRPIVRIGIGLLLAAIIILGLTYSQSQDHKRIDSYAEQIGSLLGTLESAEAELTNLPDPDSFALQKKGAARSYASEVEKVINRLKKDYPTTPPELTTPIKDERIRNFNAIVKNEDFANSLKISSESLNDAIELLEYQVASLRALANLLEYDPVLDTSVDDTQVGGRLAAAGEGLTKIVDNLQKLPDIEDTDKDLLMNEVKKVNADRQPYLDALTESRTSDELKQKYIATTIAAQIALQSALQKFWATKSLEIISNLEKQASSLRPFSYRLYK